MATAVSTPAINSNVSSFVSRKQKLLINGTVGQRRVRKDFRFATILRPARSWLNVAEGDREDIDRRREEHARKAFESGAWRRLTWLPHAANSCGNSPTFSSSILEEFA
jgi:hypothetical protein